MLYHHKIRVEQKRRIEFNLSTGKSTYNHDLSTVRTVCLEWNATLTTSRYHHNV